MNEAAQPADRADGSHAEEPRAEEPRADGSRADAPHADAPHAEEPHADAIDLTTADDGADIDLTADDHGEHGSTDHDDHRGDDAGPLPPLRAALEAVLLVVDEPVAEVVLAQVVERPTEEVGEVLRSLAEEYRADGRGFALRNVSGGWRLYTRADCAPYVERFVRDGQQARLTQAALETLAVVAYRQPVSRSRIAGIRGVNVDAVMRTLVSRGLVVEVGSERESGAVLYGTTPYFLERLGLSSLDDLPPLSDYLPDPYALDEEDVSTSS